MKRWRSTPWKRDLGLWDLVAILSGAVLLIVHQGLILPYAYSIWEAAL